MAFVALQKKSKFLLQKSKKFKDLAMEIVIKNLSKYTGKEGVNYIQTKLCPEMRDFVLQELLRKKHPKNIKSIEEFISIKRSVLALMNIRTKKLDLDVLMSFHPNDPNSVYDFNEVLMMVSIAAPNIRHLKMNIKEIERSFGNDAFRNAIMSHLKHLKELRIVEIEGGSFRMEDLSLFCRALSHLQVLSVSNICIEDDDMTKEEIIQTFGHLSLLECSASRYSKIEIWTDLPHLDIVNDVKNYGLTLEDFLEDDQAPRTRKLCYYDGGWNRSINFDFTSIRHLEISRFSSSWIKDMEMLKAITLEGLTLHLTSTEDPFVAFLLMYGSNLRKLFLIGALSSSPNVQLNRISELCPRLEVLHLKLAQVHVGGNSCRQTTFSQLTELNLSNVDALNDEVFLSTALQSAPNLTKLNIFGRNFNQADLREVNVLITEKKILRSLKSLHWRMKYPYFLYGHTEPIDDILTNAVSILPDLSDLDLSYDYANIKYKDPTSFSL
ncbi:Hypothetical predicted protein [Cloeon dipterum]|uniref:Uncharacterized protein n=1 Tax=Cloeon dipterum TaxID=197152 RepID=A0A8S1E6M7_9INSE|nr:Hypothetical predicted protein [Cloeon dipterum]